MVLPSSSVRSGAGKRCSPRQWPPGIVDGYLPDGRDQLT
jgi:hypothetical protein